MNITLDDRDEEILRHLRRSSADVGDLANALGCSSDYLESRLPALADNDLVTRTDDGGFAITDSGRRAIAGTPAGRMDDRLDTPDPVESRIRSYDLRADREAAVRGAFAFLRYWGDALEAEIVDAIYSETPAGYDSADEWWTDLVRDHLAGLPFVDPAESWDTPWRYTGTATVDSETDDGETGAGEIDADETDSADGRTAPGNRDAPEDDRFTMAGGAAAVDEPGKSSAVFPLASARYAVTQLDASPDARAAVRRAFAVLVREEETNPDALKRDVYPAVPAGYDTADEWWTDCVRDGLRQIPGVEQPTGSSDGWRYRQHATGPMSTEPDADRLNESTDHAKGESHARSDAEGNPSEDDPAGTDG